MILLYREGKGNFLLVVKELPDVTAGVRCSKDSVLTYYSHLNAFVGISNKSLNGPHVVGTLILVLPMNMRQLCELGLKKGHSQEMEPGLKTGQF